MPWLKVSDTAAQHRIVWRALEIPGASMQSMWSLFGQVLALAVEAAAFKTDYVVERGSILKFTGTPDAAQKFIADATFCGYLTGEVPLDDGRIAYRLVEDEDLFHMRLREEIDWENRRRNDTRNGALIVPIRARDGDACRWCGNVVYWGNQKGGRGATYDHLNPGVPAETPEDMVVACRSCNSSRKDNAGWAVDLLPAPSAPYFSARSAAWLTENGVPTKASAPSDKPVGRSVVATSQVSEFSRNQNQGTGNGSLVDEPLPAVQSQHTNSSLPTLSAQQMIDEFSAQIDAAELALINEQASAAEVVEEPTPVSGAPETRGDSNGHFVVPKPSSQEPFHDWEEFESDLNPKGDGFESAGSGRDGNGQGTARGSEQSAPVTDPSAGTQAANSSQLLRIDLNPKGDGFGYAGSGRDGEAVKNLATSEPKRSRHRRARTRTRRTRR
nr:MAG TPA: CRISPR-associated endonuclease [Caudoviricetes sp.]